MGAEPGDRRPVEGGPAEIAPAADGPGVPAPAAADPAAPVSEEDALEAAGPGPRAVQAHRGAADPAPADDRSPENSGAGDPEEAHPESGHPGAVGRETAAAARAGRVPVAHDDRSAAPGAVVPEAADPDAADPGSAGPGGELAGPAPTANSAAARAHSGSSWRERYRRESLQFGSNDTSAQTLHCTSRRGTEWIVVADTVADLIQ